VKLQFTDYDGPTGAYAATGKQILPIDSVAGKVALAGGAMQAGIGDQKTAEQLQTELDQILAAVTAPTSMVTE
jgi:hypothetical protein